MAEKAKNTIPIRGIIPAVFADLLTSQPPILGIELTFN